MNASLAPKLKVYVEYRACCRAGLAPGWDSDNAVQSLVLWRSWEQHLEPTRVVNVMAALPQMAKLYGSDVAKVEAAAIDVSPPGHRSGGPWRRGSRRSASTARRPAWISTPWRPRLWCLGGLFAEANDSYGALGPSELVDRVIRPAMLKQEVVPGTSWGLETYRNLSYPIIRAFRRSTRRCNRLSTMASSLSDSPKCFTL